jgi:hypothetical protein
MRGKGWKISSFLLWNNNSLTKFTFVLTHQHSDFLPGGKQDKFPLNSYLIFIQISSIHA